MSNSSTNPEPARSVARRRFTMLDAIVMIAAVAVGQKGYLAVMSIYATTGIDSPSVVLRGIRMYGLLDKPYLVLFWFEITAPLLLSLALSLLALRRLPPRPEGSLLVRQPGAVAISAATLGAALVFVSWGLVGYPLHRAGLFAVGPLSTLVPLIFRVMLASMVASGAAIASGWGNLLLNGPSLHEADWIERSGRILGVVWLFATPIYLWAALIIY